MQVFTPGGGFLRQCQAARDRLLRGLAVTRGEEEILAQGGELQCCEGASGEPLEPVSRPPGGFDAVALTPDGRLRASSCSAGDEALVVLDPEGETLLALSNAVREQTGDSELGVRVAADGPGKLLGLGTFDETAVVFSPEGRYLSRVGSAGAAPPGTNLHLELRRV